ncbi:hypothetical protein J7I94_01965 [Streptomyces sp. ISL-12]|uniref:hypothetical protein n=1 Tax=Streptomyces sp. ISL-12 TaxID=2819177 RepID=UPI001BECA711|nr:hypothetical protein [Streptomyces sp. ISL-12]MBT2409337.1 hypothetical protein [Streptomyces sp. ISL-12]
MQPINLETEVTRLRTLGSDFEDLHSDVLHLRPKPGADARQKITTAIVTTNQLVGRALERLEALAGSQYTAVPGSRPSLEAMVSVVHAATTAAGGLAAALSENPAGGVPYSGSSTNQDTKYKTASSALPEHLTEAAHQLNLAFTGCYYLARSIPRDLQHHSGQQHAVTAVKLSAGQYETLVRLSEGGGRVYTGTRHNYSRATDGNGRTVNQATLRVLTKHALVEVDTSTSLFTGQRLVVTEAGRQAIAAYEPSASPVRPAAPASTTTVRRTR